MLETPTTMRARAVAVPHSAFKGGPLRILQLGSGMPGWAGTEKHIIDITRGLLSSGHQVTLGCADGSVLADKTNELRIPRISLEMRRTHDWIQLPRFVRAMRGRFDVVHIHGYRDYIVPALAARTAGISAVILTRHLPHPFRSKATAYVCSRIFYDRIIAVSDFIAGIVTDSGVDPSRIVTVRNGMDWHENVTQEDASALREEMQISADSFLVAAAGRFTFQKGFDVLLRSVADLHKRGVQVACIIFGKGTDFDAHVSLARSLGIESITRLPGFRADANRLWAACDVVATPSVGAEALSYSAMEALFAGKPVVASRIGGIPEVVTPECGFLVEPGNCLELTKALEELSRSRELRKRMGEAARVRSRSFSLDVAIQAILKEYYGVLATRPAVDATERYE